MKLPIPVRYSFFVGKRVIRNAVSGITIPIAREYPLVAHCPIEVLTQKYSTRLGSAVVIAVDRVDEAIPETTIQRKINVRFCGVIVALLFSMIFLHSVPYFSIDVLHHLFQCLFTQLDIRR